MSVETLSEYNTEKEAAPETPREKIEAIYEQYGRRLLKGATDAAVYGCDMEALFDKSGEVSGVTKARNFASSATAAIAWGLMLSNQGEAAMIASIASRGLMAPELLALVKKRGPQFITTVQASLNFLKDDLQPLQESFRNMGELLMHNSDLITLDLNK